MRPRRSGGGSRPLVWYMRTVDVAVSAWLASCSMVIRPSSSMRVSVLLRSKHSASIYSQSQHFTERPAAGSTVLEVVVHGSRSTAICAVTKRSGARYSAGEIVGKWTGIGSLAGAAIGGTYGTCL